MLSGSVTETLGRGENLGRQLKPGDAVLLYGEMGAGKTHFIKGLALGMGIAADVTSPTFALVNEYEGAGGKLFHFDLFRITTHDDLYAIGFYDYIGKGVIAVEWSENIPGLEAEFDSVYKVVIDKDKSMGENTRIITISKITGFLQL